jgi:hypothetical protein
MFIPVALFDNDAAGYGVPDGGLAAFSADLAAPLDLMLDRLRRLAQGMGLQGTM